VRSRLSVLAAWSFSRLFTRNRLTRHDAPLSARRAYTRAEAVALAQRAGWRAPRTESFRLIRMVLRDDATL
jgi:Tfp pilus assembly protein FimT